jgi:phenylacetate-CoA ligase
VWSAYQALGLTQWLSPPELEQRQLAQARHLLSHCGRHVPYYAELLESHGIDPESIRSLDDFRRIPILSRRTFQERFEDMRAVRLPEGVVALGEDGTSGSCGAPVRVLKTSVFYVWWLACHLRGLEWGGIDPLGSMAAIRPTLTAGTELERFRGGVRLPCWEPALDPLIETGPLYVMDISQCPRRQIEWLAEAAPDYLLSHASNLEMLASLLRESPVRPLRLRAVLSISETMTDDARAAVEAAFGAPVRNIYSSAEAGYLASPCPEGHGLHIHAENVLLEVLDEDGRPCPPGQSGRVVLTHLHGLLTPFVRYDIGDVVTPGAGPCLCGRGLPLLAEVEGKERPFFRLADGGVRHSSALVHALSAVGGHHQHQAVQKSVGHFVIRLVPSGGWTAGHEEKIRAAVIDLLGAPARVDVEVRERLDLPPGGKLRGMVCEVPAA